MLVKTVFHVGENLLRKIENVRLIDMSTLVEVEAVGQEAATAIMNKFPDKRIVLLGFIIGDTFKAVNLN